MRNSTMGAPWGIDPTTYHTMSGCSIMKLDLAPILPIEKVLLQQS